MLYPTPPSFFYGTPAMHHMYLLSTEHDAGTSISLYHGQVVNAREIQPMSYCRLQFWSMCCRTRCAAGEQGTTVRTALFDTSAEDAPLQDATAVKHDGPHIHTRCNRGST